MEINRKGTAFANNSHENTEVCKVIFESNIRSIFIPKD